MWQYFHCLEQNMRKEMNSLDRYNEIFKSVLLLEDEDIASASIDNVIQWDSLEHFRLITEIEETFDVQFKNEEIAAFVSYKSGLEILKKYGVTV